MNSRAINSFSSLSMEMIKYNEAYLPIRNVNTIQTSWIQSSSPSVQYSYSNESDVTTLGSLRFEWYSEFPSNMSDPLPTQYTRSRPIIKLLKSNLSLTAYQQQPLNLSITLRPYYPPLETHDLNTLFNATLVQASYRIMKDLGSVGSPRSPFSMDRSCIRYSTDHPHSRRNESNCFLRLLLSLQRVYS